MVLMPLGPQLKRIYDINAQEWSLVIASYTFAAFISGLLSILMIDKTDRKKFLLVIFSGFTVGTFLCGFADSYFELVLTRIVTGFFGGILGATVLSIVGDLIEPEKRAQAMGIVMTGFSAAAAFGVPFGLYFGTQFNWHFPFHAISVINVFTFIGIYKFVPNIDSHVNSQSKVIENIKLIFTDKNKINAFLFLVMIVFGQFTVITFLSPYMVANVGFKETDLTFIYLTGGILTIFSSPLFGKIADKKGKTKVFNYLLILSIIPIVLITNLGAIPIILVLVITSSFFVFVGGRSIPAMAIVLATSEPNLRGSFMSIRSAIQQLSSGLASFTAGLIMVDLPDGTYGNYNHVGYLAIIACFASIYLAHKIELKY